MPLDRLAIPLIVLAPALGFRAKTGVAGSGEWVREGLWLRQEHDWLVLADRRARASSRDAVGSSDAGPGLWRWVRRDGGRAERVFEIAPLAVGMEDAVEPPESSQSAAPLDASGMIVAWAEATRDGSVSTSGLTPVADVALPPADSLVADVALPPADSLVARAGEHVVRGALIAEADRVAVVFPHVVDLPRSLPASRLAWVNEVCQASQDRWRLVRFGVVEAPPGDEIGSRVQAHVDLTLAPPPLAPALYELAAASLQAAVSWALPGLRAASDLELESSVLARAPGWIDKRTRSSESKSQNTRRNGVAAAPGKTGRTFPPI